MTSKASGTQSGTQSVESTQTGSKRKSNDIGWDYGFCPDPTNLDRVQCILCGKICSGGVCRLKQHIAHVPGNVAPCDKSNKTDQLRCRDAINGAKLKKKGKKEYDEALRAEARSGFHTDENTIDVDEIEGSLGSMRPPHVLGPMDNFANKLDPKQASIPGKGKKIDAINAIRKQRISYVNSFVGRWAYEAGIPAHAFERDSFKMMSEVMGQFGPGYPTHSRYELNNPILKGEVERTKKLVKKNEEEWKLEGCSIMTDAWSDRKRRSIMNLCVNSKMGTVFLSSKECSSEAHTGQHIFEYVEACIQEVGPEHVVQVVTDNATNNMAAAKLLHEKRPKIFWTSCATHTINLMLEGIGGIKRFKTTLDQAKKLTIFIYAHHKTLAMMRKFTNKRDIVRPGVTRFASAYLTLQSLSEKKEQLRQMFCSNEWEECKFSGSVKGKTSHKLVTGAIFWAGVTTCLKVFTPLVKVLRMVDADWKPSMGFVYGEIIKAKQEIIDVLGGNKKAYDPIIEIIEKKMKGRLDTKLHLTAYLLNPYYLYKDPQIQTDPDVMDAVLEFFDTLLVGDIDMQKQVLTIELPKYQKKADKFGRELALSTCEVNDANYDPAIWWSLFGVSTPHLTKIAKRILSLTSSSSGCERTWSSFEGIHTKKRNKLDAARLNDLVYVQCNANLMQKNKRRKDRNLEVLLASESHTAEEWIVDCDVVEVVPEPLEETHEETVSDDLGTNELGESSIERGLLDEDIESESEEEMTYEEVEYDSDGVHIKEL